jgi:hypothetical protein
MALILLGGAVLAAEPTAIAARLRPVEERTPAPGFALASATNTTISLSR